jgi:hypothetical protein
LRRIQRHPRNAHGTPFLPGGTGTGTGNMLAGAERECPDREIVNRPGNGNYLPPAFSALRASGHHVLPITRGLGPEPTGDSGEPDALTSPRDTRARHGHRQPRGPAEVSSMARRS